MMSDDNDGQMRFWDLGGLKLPDICLTGDEKLRKNLTQETCPDRGSNPGAHAIACPTAVDPHFLSLGCYIQGGRKISAIIVTDRYLCYKEPKSPYNFFSYFNI